MSNDNELDYPSGYMNSVSIRRLMQAAEDAERIDILSAVVDSMNNSRRARGYARSYEPEEVISMIITKRSISEPKEEEPKEEKDGASE